MILEENNGKLIVSLYDYTTAWARPYIDNGYPVICWDKQVEGDILEGFTRLCHLIEETGYPVYGLLAAPPCTDFTKSGARHWAKKDSPTTAFDVWDCQTEHSEALVSIVLHFVDLFKPKFWAMENPPGRLERLIPDLKPYRSYSFHPYHFGDPYSKETILWGRFNTALVRTPVEPVWMTTSTGKRFAPLFWHTGGNTKNRQNLRSVTPKGFAQAFYNANI